jgi:small subunit ribosomal protein S17
MQTTDNTAPNAGTRRHQKRMLGTVVSAKMSKTIVVRSEWRVRHPRYGKTLTHSTKFAAHDEKGQAKVGDTVEIAECRPLSKTKRWRLVKVLRRGMGDLPNVAGVEEVSRAKETAPKAPQSPSSQPAS